MIRHRQGNDFLLITQDDHARLAGEFARHFGNADFARPVRFEEVMRGVALHDCGWPVHDDAPTLNRNGEPVHVLESPMPIATKVWSESARRAVEVGPYEGLLVSLHVLNLSAIAQKHDATPHERYENRHDLFLLNRFQQEQIELQENLRRQLGLAVGIPLWLGLAKPGTSEAEERLRFDFRVLQAMDRISLDLACREDLFPALEPVHAHPGAAEMQIKVGHPREGALTLATWP